jgi:hypothetical protein
MDFLGSAQKAMVIGIMSLRDNLVLRLVRLLHGPQGGPAEVLPADRNPADEYITGILAPRPDPNAAAAGPVHDIDGDADTIEGDVDSDEDEDDPAVIAAGSAFSPALDPRSLPRSIGLTFVVEADEPQINICATYARYFRMEDDRWQRQPHCFVSGNKAVVDGAVFSGPANTEIRIRRTAIPGRSTAHRISVFLINAASPQDDPERPPSPESLIFQPQIRVVLGGKCRPDSLLRKRVPSLKHCLEPGMLEEESLDLLYRDRPILARGHMCAAVWREIDPENSSPDSKASPFKWIDENVVPVTDRATFQSADIRTEILPLYSVCAPVTDWNPTYGAAPELDPEKISELWDGSALRSALSPLPDAYNRWIQRQRTAAADLDSMQHVAQRHLDLCDVAKDRLLAAINLLSDERNLDIRLAFCFANKTIALQANWKAQKIQWYPFQLAFILLCIPGIAVPHHSDRGICDLLWFATGVGKTEAYLGLSAFTLALRRLRAERDNQGFRGDTGVGVISRYTLRLLTIQQFRRALGMITAAEFLRVQSVEGGAIGWRPRQCSIADSYLWGTARFSAGLWVGGGVTPNRLENVGWPEQIYGALEILQSNQIGTGVGEPAQILQCPCCGTHLAISQPRREERPAFPPGHVDRLHFVFYCETKIPTLAPAILSSPRLQITTATISALPAPNYHILSIDFVALNDGVSARDIDDWWATTVTPVLGRWATLQSTRASRPGYFFRTYLTQQRKEKRSNFEIYCPAPKCGLAGLVWKEKAPVPIQARAAGQPDWQEVIRPFQSSSDPNTGTRSPIPALTVDDQIYRHPPSLVVATVDKFARLAYEPRASSIFGHVTHYHGRQGYYRAGALSHLNPGDDHPPVPALTREVNKLPPPDLILQDELHLIDGPLGSMVGIYETAIDALAEKRTDDAVVSLKYITSTATARLAGEQVKALFARSLAQFPPPGLTADDNFFSLTSERHPMESLAPGRLYLGVCAPGKGAQTPIVRIWSTLLQGVYEEQQNGRPAGELDGYWTLVGYFNAIRELAGATGLLRQDIVQRLSHIAMGNAARPVAESIELSSRADALQLPALLSRLDTAFPSDALDVAFVTSMFGTGVDVSRLALMCVHGQPKTSSSYIQATGRVGRREGGLVVTFLRASRPRDLDHYEFFAGYHRQLYRAVEPVTVAPFSPRARERALGPLCVVMLRQAAEILGYPVHAEWRREQRITGGLLTGSWRMATARMTPEVVALAKLFEIRAQQQPDGRRPNASTTADEVKSELDVWNNLARRSNIANNALLYNEYSMTADPSHPVVLGDAQHQRRQLEVAYEDAPQSLRDVEPTTGFKV